MLTTEHWRGKFGNHYTDRNLNIQGREAFWNDLCRTYEISSVLEVGCGVGANLVDLEVGCVGVDVNPLALELARDEGISVVQAEAIDLPFGTNSFDLVMTFGVLIHIGPDDLEAVMREIVRCSRRFVFCGEYAGDDEIPYRGEVLWRRDYGKLYEEIGLKVVDTGILAGQPWDSGEVAWWLLSQNEVHGG